MSLKMYMTAVYVKGIVGVMIIYLCLAPSLLRVFLFSNIKSKANM